MPFRRSRGDPYPYPSPCPTTDISLDAGSGTETETGTGIPSSKLSRQRPDYSADSASHSRWVAPAVVSGASAYENRIHRAPNSEK